MNNHTRRKFLKAGGIGLTGVMASPIFTNTNELKLNSKLSQFERGKYDSFYFQSENLRKIRGGHNRRSGKGNSTDH